MSPRAPAHVPVELRLPDGKRWFRLSSAVGADGMALADVVPEDLAGPLHVAFHLPGDRLPIRCLGRAASRVVGHGENERAELSAIAFLDLDEASRDRIINYVNERLGPYV